MNRGSALKWIELIQNPKFIFNDGYGLKYTPFPRVYCPNGKFARLLSDTRGRCKVQFYDNTIEYYSLKVLFKTLGEWDPTYSSLHSPRGILEEFVMGGLDTLAWHGCGYVNVEGNELSMSKEALKKIKAKTDLSEVDDLLVNNLLITKEEIVEYIQHNYERL